MAYTLQGKIIVDPIRETFDGRGMRKKHKESTMILQLGFGEFARLYRTFIEKRYGIFLQAPMFRDHVTIVGGNEVRKIKNRDAWKTFHGQTLTFEVDPSQIYKAWQFWVVPAACPAFQKIRRSLGLMTDPNFHITVGRDYEIANYPTVRPEEIVPFSKLTNGCENE